MSFILPSLVEKTNKCVINVIVMQHHRRPSTQISRKQVVLGYIVAGFGTIWHTGTKYITVLGRFGWFCWFCWWFWVVPGFSNYRYRLLSLPLYFRLWHCYDCKTNFHFPTAMPILTSQNALWSLRWINVQVYILYKEVLSLNYLSLRILQLQELFNDQEAPLTNNNFSVDFCLLVL